MKRNIFRKLVNEDYTYIISKEEPMSYETESYQKALINLDYVNVDGNYKVIQFTSTLEGEGKTTTVSNLAYLLGQRGRKVLVIDLDLRRPKMHRVFNVPNDKGLNDYLLDKYELNDIIGTSKELGFDYIVTGQKTTSVTNVLTSNKLADLISTLRDEYDYIIVDTPPLLAVSDSLFIAKLVDGVITVVAQGVARKKDVKEGIKTLRQAGVEPIGTILTQVKIPRRGSNYYYYTDEVK